MQARGVLRNQMSNLMYEMSDCWTVVGELPGHPSYSVMLQRCNIPTME